MLAAIVVLAAWAAISQPIPIQVSQASQPQNNRQQIKPEQASQSAPTEEVMYWDDLQVCRRTGFCRWHNPRALQFRPTKNTDYEYVD